MSCPTGTSPRMAINPASTSTSDITAPISTETVESAASSSDQGNTSSFEPKMLTLCLFGESSSTIAGKLESTAPYSETKAPSYRPTLSDRLTPLLISAGLVKGITHSSIRKQSGAAIRGSALWPLDGGDVDTPKADYLSSNVEVSS